MGDCNPLLTPVQALAAYGSSSSTPRPISWAGQIDEGLLAAPPYPPVPRRCAVTGGTGFVGIRLVEMLAERGAEEVVAFDIVPASRITAFIPWRHPAIKYVEGDVAHYKDVEAALAGADCVWHLAAAVGPFHPRPLYDAVNHGGTRNVLRACKALGIRKLVFSSSPSTRFRGSLWSRPCVDGLTESQMPALPLEKYMQPYAATKARGELAVARAVEAGDVLAVSVAPHQVYGPRDNLFLPNMLEAAASGKLRIFGGGTNRICFTHVDNYAHALTIAERRLFDGSPVLGRFYIVTDGRTHPCYLPRGGRGGGAAGGSGATATGVADRDARPGGMYCVFWRQIAMAVKELGLGDLDAKAHLPFWLLYLLALAAEAVGWLSGAVFKLNVFNVFVLTMHRWFDIGAAEDDLGYRPIIPFAEGWADTIEWFRRHWLPRQKAGGGLRGLAEGSQAKIDIQHTGTTSKRSPGG